MLQRQPLTGKTCTDLKRGDIVDLPGHHVTDVVVRSGGETLREGEDYGVDAAGGMVEFKRDLPGSILIAFRRGPEPRREVLVPTFGIPWTEEPLLSDRVTIGVDTQAPRYGAGGFPGGGGGGGVSRWSAEELRDILTVDSVTVGEGRGFPGGGGGSGVAVSRGGGYVMVSTPSTKDPIIGDLG